uniref:Putative alpha-L-fucosidase n=1 Tax=Strigamia maritima TaxID=126957 RepID=T1IV28_STRMM
MKAIAIYILLLLAANLTLLQAHYDPTWESLDARPLPTWYDQAKIGIFIHWGVFSVPSFGSEWFWNAWMNKNPAAVKFMDQNYKPNFTYADFAPMFTAEFYDPDFWAELFQASGAKYIVLTSKHHEGYTMWPSKYSWNWNSMDVGPRRDLLGDLAKSIRKNTDLVFGLYHSLFEWYNPLYLQDKANKFNTTYFVTTKTMPELKELVMQYKPSVVWSDGEWEAPDTYWDSKGFLAWLYNESPVKDVVVTNDRWGSGTLCKHGGYYTCTDKYNPGKWVLQKHKWENCMTIDSGSWGYRRNAQLSDYLTINDLIQDLASTISCGGNLLMNVGPTHDGRILPIFEERLRQLGAWLNVNGEAVYASNPWTHQNDTITPNIWYTSKNDETISIYAFVLTWPRTNSLLLGAVDADSITDVSMLGLAELLQWKAGKQGGIVIEFPMVPLPLLPSQWAWVLKLN